MLPPGLGNTGYNTGYNAVVIVSFWESSSAPPTWDLGLLTVEIIRVLQQHCSRLELGTPGALHLDHTDKGLQQVNFFSDMWRQLAYGLACFISIIILYLYHYFIQLSTLRNIVC